jgi:hypothetical protein
MYSYIMLHTLTGPYRIYYIYRVVIGYFSIDLLDDWMRI